MPRGRPHASWLRQVESYLKDTGMAGLASAWAMARRRPKEYRRKVDAATRCSIEFFSKAESAVEQGFAATTLERYSFSLRLAIAHTHARLVMPVSFR